MARSSAAFPTSSRPKRSPEAAPRTSVTCLRIADLPTWAVRQLEAGVIPEPLVVAEGALVAGVDAAAHRAGVRIGERVGRVSALCAEARITQRDLTVERVAWDWALERVFDSTPFLESPRPGLVFLRGALPDEVAALAWELGAYSATADSHGTSALAALTAKAGQVVTVNSVNAFLANAPLGYTKHLGVAPWVLERLALLGLHHLGELQRFTLRQLSAQFGAAQGQLLHALATDNDVRPVPTYRPPPQVVIEEPFDDGLSEPAHLEPYLRRAVQRAASALEALGRVAWRVMLEVAYGPAVRLGKRLHEGVSDVKSLLLNARKLLETLTDGREAGGLTLRLSALERPRVKQDSLFGALERPAVQAAIRRVSERFPAALGTMVVARYAVLPEQGYRFVAFGGTNFGSAR